MVPKRALLVSLAFASFSLLTPLRTEADPIIAAGTPFSVDAGPPEVFVLPIEITNAVELITWQLDVSFDASVVQVNESCDPSSDPYCGDFPPGPVTEGPFTSSGGLHTTLFVPGVVDNFAGLVSLVAGAYTDLPPNPSGGGILAYVEFYWVDSQCSLENPDCKPMLNVQNTITSSAVPEPTTLALLAAGFLVLLRRRLPIAVRD